MPARFSLIFSDELPLPLQDVGRTLDPRTLASSRPQSGFLHTGTQLHYSSTIVAWKSEPPLLYLLYPLHHCQSKLLKLMINSTMEQNYLLSTFHYPVQTQIHHDVDAMAISKNHHTVYPPHLIELVSLA